MSQAEIKICDAPELRVSLGLIMLEMTKPELCDFSIALIKHTFNVIGSPSEYNDLCKESCELLRTWKQNKFTVPKVYQIAFKIYKEIRKCRDGVSRVFLNVLGYSIFTIRAREYLFTALDHAVKINNLLYNDDPEQARKERLWQLNKIV